MLNTYLNSRLGSFALLVIGLWQMPMVRAVDNEFDWPQFLGQNRNGISMETGLLDAFDASGPAELWRIAGGVGMSGISIADGRMLTLLQKSGKQYVLALDSETGKLIWETPVAPAYENAMGDGPRATPTIFGDHVFVYTGEGILVSLKLDKGTLQWSKNLPVELKGKPSEYGMSCSPLVIDDQVVVSVGAPRATLVAVNKATGSVKWTAGSGPAGYSSPVSLKVAGNSQVVAFLGNEVIGVNAASGNVLWSYPYVTDYACNTASPISVGDDIFVTAGENQGCVLLRLEAEGKKYATKEIWESRQTKSVLRSEWQTPILLNGYLYGFDNVGSAGPVTHLTCVNAKTGETKWREARFGKGNLIYADGKLLISTMEGELILVNASSDRYEELGRAKVIGKTRQAPTLSNGRVYLRDDHDIVCVDMKAK